MDVSDNIINGFGLIQLEMFIKGNKQIIDLNLSKCMLKRQGGQHLS